MNHTGQSGRTGLFFRVRSPAAPAAAALIAAAATLAACSQPDTPAAAPPAAPAATAAATPAAATTPAAQPLRLLCPAEGGAFTLAPTEAELRTLFGDANVVRETINLAEGETRPGLVIHPSDPTRRLEVLLADGASGRVETIRAMEGATAWVGRDGLRVGSTIADVERVNGRPFTLYGFGWDYGGSISNWRDGTLALPDGVACAFGLRLQAGAENNESALGDSEFASDSAAVRAARPVVSEMSLFFTAPDP